MRARVHDRPFFDQYGAELGGGDGLPLYITGTLPEYDPGTAYEARLPIHNAIGNCTVELLSGTLPDGGGVAVDNGTSEVVVAWPAFVADPIALVNPGFETGDLSDWTYSTIGGNATMLVSSVHSSAGQYSAHWPGGSGTGGEGGIEFVAVNATKGPVVPGTLIRASVRGMYNPNGHTKGSQFQARLHWYDADDNYLGDSKGFRFYGRKYNGKWVTSPVEGHAPANAAFVRVAMWGRARGGDVFFDDAAWELPVVTGTLGGEVCLSLRVRDSAGRTADWNGCTNGSAAQVACGVAQASGGVGFPTQIDVVLGTGTGMCDLIFSAGNAPDKFEVWIGNEKVLDTGYWGDPANQSVLDAALAARGLAPETITDSAGPELTDTLSFAKTTDDPIAHVLVYAPTAGTGWFFTLTCPDGSDVGTGEDGGAVAGGVGAPSASNSFSGTAGGAGGGTTPVVATPLEDWENAGGPADETAWTQEADGRIKFDPTVWGSSNSSGRLAHKVIIPVIGPAYLFVSARVDVLGLSRGRVNLSVMGHPEKPDQGIAGAYPPGGKIGVGISGMSENDFYIEPGYTHASLVLAAATDEVNPVWFSDINWYVMD